MRWRWKTGESAGFPSMNTESAIRARVCAQTGGIMADAINFNGKVEWSGENPGISLKEHPDGPWTNLASFFRVVLSPYGRGHALVLLQSPNEANPPEGRPNICFHDNEELARYLVKDFVSHFGAYRGLPSLTNLTYRKLD